MKRIFAAVQKAFAVPTAQELAQREHAEASRQLLVALTAREHAEAQVNYHTARVMRLRQSLK